MYQSDHDQLLAHLTDARIGLSSLKAALGRIPHGEMSSEMWDLLADCEKWQQSLESRREALQLSADLVREEKQVEEAWRLYRLAEIGAADRLSAWKLLHHREICLTERSSPYPPELQQALLSSWLLSWINQELSHAHPLG